MRSIVVGGLALALATSAFAQTTTPTPPTIVFPPTPAAAIAPISTPHAVLRAGTAVSFKMAEEVTTKGKNARVGQRIQLEVAAPVEVNGVTVIPAGTPAWGELTGVRNKGMWGKSGKLDAQMRFLRVNGRQIRLSGTFDDKGTTGTAGVVGAVALLPLAGFFISGTSATLPKGGAVNGFIDEDVELAFDNTSAQPMQVPVTAPAMTVPAAPAATAAPTGT